MSKDSRNRYLSCAENLLGNLFRHWIQGGQDGSSRSDESTSRQTGTRGTRADSEIPGGRSDCKSPQVEGSDGSGKSDGHKLCRGRQIFSASESTRIGEMRVMARKRKQNTALTHGAYGYTGRLTAEPAAVKKLDVVLAGRNKDALVGSDKKLGEIGANVYMLPVGAAPARS